MVASELKYLGGGVCVCDYLYNHIFYTYIAIYIVFSPNIMGNQDISVLGCDTTKCLGDFTRNCIPISKCDIDMCFHLFPEITPNCCNRPLTHSVYPKNPNY